MSEYYETIIVGAGPAGNSCAWKLKKQGKEVLILNLLQNKNPPYNLFIVNT